MQLTEPHAIAVVSTAKVGPADGPGEETAAVVDQGIQIELAEIAPRILVIVHGAEIGADSETLFDPADRSGEGAAAVGETEAKTRQSFKHAAEQERTNG